MNSGMVADPFYFKLNGKMYFVTNQGDGIPKEVQQGVAEGSGCNMTTEGESCPVHGMAECYGMGSGAASTTGNPPLEEQRREGDALLARIKSLAMVR
jgi:hypothetical protein